MRNLPFILFVATQACPALTIREYSPERHDRFVTQPDGSLDHNPDAFYTATRYTALGYATQGGRQFALVTPEHVLLANHFSGGGNLSFINGAGVKFDRSLGTKTNIPNGSGGTSDLAIMKISAPLGPDTNILPFPVMNLANEAAYSTPPMTITVFGQSRRAGRGMITSFQDTAVPAANIDSTRTFTFNYLNSFGNQDDCFFVGGDSGSPSFITVGNRPALVGVHLAVGNGPGFVFNVDTFVPHYTADVNALLAPEGYRLIPANPDPVTLTASAGSDAGLRQVESGTLTVTLANGSAPLASNPRLEISFPAGSIPDSLAAPGWIVEIPAPGEYRLRRATLNGASSATATATYSSVPVVSGIPVGIVHRSDGSGEIQQTVTLEVEETFAGFVAALSSKGAGDDPDGDGFPNLLEYALGGEPGVNSAVSPSGLPLAPAVIEAGGSLEFTFARRTDAAQRGLAYNLLFSPDLSENSFEPTTPPGFAITSAPFDPPVVGFEEVTATLPVSGKLFMRLEVVLE